ncbi:MAG: hypothetical protein UT05_C0001G0082 [Parcubacteria group bacterium GW2011_GWF2_38_76]|nr:MAG: hypothetical protein UT05_C0001G0082 [Parcubacteria group bacterium GW2011_GWF2_38_76]HBM45941.1 hypothetical protein [Patescibacteria group bacterium]
MKKAKMVAHHDDPPCREKLEDDHYCPKCKLYPDSQSICFHSYCPDCEVPLKEMRCPKCKKKFKSARG